MSRKTIAVDWDGTLVEYHGYKGPMVYGAPVHKMVDRIHQWLVKDFEVIIFTARVSDEHDPERVVMELETIEVALHDMGLPSLLITANKYARVSQFWDDRGVCVNRNTGICKCENLGTI